MGKPVDDSPEMIEMCLECPFPECINCLGSQSAYGWAIRFWFSHQKKFEEEELQKLREKVKARLQNNG